MRAFEKPMRARLFHLQLGSTNPQALARFYAQVFGLTLDERAGSWVCRGANRCIVVSSGAPKSLVSAGYAVADNARLQALQARAGAWLAPVTPLESELLGPEAIALHDPDGNRIVYGLPTQAPLAEPATAPYARLQHVVVGSTNTARMVEFYMNVVGLRKSDDVMDESGGLRTSFMRSDDEHHSFAVFQTSSKRFDHHCYELPDWNGIRDWGDRLAALRIPVQWGPGRHGPGNNLFLFFHDLDGNWVELSAELEIVAPDRPAGVWPHEERTLNSWGRGYLRS